MAPLLPAEVIVGRPLLTGGQVLILAAGALAAGVVASLMVLKLLLDLARAFVA